jgi:acyl-CoA synthetase (AMP-forming)/AMP-acid ligase II
MSEQTAPASLTPLTTLPAHLAHWAQRTPDRRALTFVEYPLPHSRGTHHALTWRQLAARTRALAARLAGTVVPGDRVALLCPQGPDFVVGFLAALSTGAIAVPMFTPDLPGHGDRLAGVLSDALPAAVLTTSGAAESVRAFLAVHDLRPRIVLTDPIDAASNAGADSWTPPALDEHATAYLQYTSGSTRLPAGVEISHANVVANARQALAAYRADTQPVTMVGWLPLYHDMGLVLSIATPVVQGTLSVLMDPVAFLQQPVRWLRLLSAHPNTISAAPNFAYDYCAASVDAREKSGLRLDRVLALLNGSEPVRPETADRFHAAFADHGLSPTAHCPSYGLAEATVFVSAHRPGVPARRHALDRKALADGRAVATAPDDPGGVLLASCGRSVGQRIRIAAPDTVEPLPDGEIGEILVQGPNVGRGYWNRERETRETFGSQPPDSTDRWLRTGDLGTLLEGELLVTGRLKDLIIVDGRNHYPQDIEATAQTAHPAIRTGRLAAFSVPGRSGAETVVVVAEHVRGLVPTDEDAAEVARAVRADVSALHAVRLADFLLVPPGGVPRTSSGKVSRALARSRYLERTTGDMDSGTGTGTGAGTGTLPHLSLALALAPEPDPDPGTPTPTRAGTGAGGSV